MAMSRDDAMKKISELAQGEALLGLGEKLKAEFGEKNCSFQTEPAPYHIIKSPDGGKDIIVVNVKYAEDPSFVSGSANSIAIG